MKKILAGSALALIVFFGVVRLVGAETGTTTDLSKLSKDELIAKVESLTKQVTELKAQVVTLNKIKENKVQFLKKMYVGMSDEEIKKLQEFLATDRSIYPEGKVTGFFGPLTKLAIQRLQAKYALPVTGEVDDATQELLNEILDAQGVTDRIPPGLLTAPGLQGRVKIESEIKNGKVHYKIEVSCKDGSDSCKDDEDQDDDSDDDTDDDEDDDNSGSDDDSDDSEDDDEEDDD